MKHKGRLYYLSALIGLLVITALALSIRNYYRGSFKETPTGLQYQVIRKGKGPWPQEGDILLLDVSYKTEKGVVLFSTADQEFPMALPYSENTVNTDGGFLEAIGMLQKGGGIVCKLDIEKVLGGNLEHITAQYGLKKNEKIFLHLQLQDIMPEETYKKWETEHSAMLQQRNQEKATQQLKADAETIVNYLKSNRIEARSTDSGLYYVIDTPGQGAQPKLGDRVKVHYTGRLLDGKVFDTSLADIAKQHGMYTPGRAYEAIEFQLGAGQVIRGWDEGVMCLRQGAKARLFIPSTLAYGSRGIGNGLIPANAILIFDVVLVDIQG
ncbi:MAG: FKBP-type peptidyl-prolyl cis-trans isomerase [Amoebophilaceae bacterium]|jgi:FKBP-type peptidyl-prolyl cis-trans isomerase|nr:FKBP-type peptidyl-prolyl cis-trans isomerase [Amoebophilaceae bacterium]